MECDKITGIFVTTIKHSDYNLRYHNPAYIVVNEANKEGKKPNQKQNVRAFRIRNGRQKPYRPSEIVSNCNIQKRFRN